MRVGSYMAGASPYGVLDMAGNVRELVADRLDAGYYAVSPALRPAGPSYGVHRVDRGGAYSQIGAFMRSSFRGWNLPDNGYYDTGFRCALSQSPWGKGGRPAPLPQLRDEIPGPANRRIILGDGHRT